MVIIGGFMPMSKPKFPMDAPGLGWRVGASIIIAFGWMAFIVVWLLLYAPSASVYHSLAAIIVSIIAAMALLAGMWAPWGMRYGSKYAMQWKEGKYNMQNCGSGRAGAGGAAYGFGFLGALVYYLTTAPSLWVAFLGIFKAAFWPAFLVYGLLKLIGA